MLLFTATARERDSERDPHNTHTLTRIHITRVDRERARALTDSSAWMTDSRARMWAGHTCKPLSVCCRVAAAFMRLVHTAGGGHDSHTSDGLVRQHC